MSPHRPPGPVSRHRTRRAFRQGLDDGAVELVYQPLVDPADDRVVAVEALVRWRRDGRLTGPDEFLPAVEPSALMTQVTDRVLDLALPQLAAWRGAGIELGLSINVSAADLADEGLPERIASRLARHGVAAQHLTIEVTETALLAAEDRAWQMLTALDAIGIRIAVDDFGTGHASLSRLHGFPVCEVKIDRAFVTNRDRHARTYLRAIVGFGRSLGLRVVAEGVEDLDTLALLGDLHCDLAQGYAISRPLQALAMTDWLTTRPTRIEPLVLAEAECRLR